MKISKLCLLTLCSLALCACGGTDDSTDISTNKTSGGASQVDTIKDKWWETTGQLEKDESGKVVYDEVEIDLTTVVNGEDFTAFNDIINRFNNEYRGRISVTVTSLNQSSFEKDVSSQISNNNNAPDLIMSHQKGHMTFAENKLIQPFNEIMEEAENEISMYDYAEGLANHADLGYDGYTFGVPIDAQSEVVYYNKSLLNKYGDGQLPSNRTELIELCKKVAREEGITPISWSTSLSFFPSYVFPTAVVQNGGHFYDDEYRADWASNPDNLKAFKDAIQSIREMCTSSPKIADYDLPESAAVTRFVTGKALFFVGMPWNARSLLTTFGQNHGGLSYDVVKTDYVGGASLAKWFALDDTKPYAEKIFGDSHFFAMSKTVKNINKKAAIVEFIKWFTDTPSVGAAWAEAGHITASTIVSNDSEYLSNQFVDAFINKFYPDINFFECPGNTPYYEDTFNMLTTLFVNTKDQSQANDERNIRSAEETINDTIDFLG